MHRIFVGGKGRKYVIADSALKPVQVHSEALWLGADEHHRSFAPRIDGALKCDRWNGGRRPLRLGHDASLTHRRERNTLSHRQIPGYGTVIERICAAATSNTSQFGPGATQGPESPAAGDTFPPAKAVGLRGLHPEGRADVETCKTNEEAPETAAGEPCPPTEAVTGLSYQ